MKFLKTALVIVGISTVCISGAFAKGEKGVDKGAKEDLSRIPSGVSASDLQQSARARVASTIPPSPTMAGTSATCNAARSLLDRRNAEIRSCMENGPTRSGSPQYEYLNRAGGSRAATADYCRNTVRVSVPTSFADLAADHAPWVASCIDTVTQQHSRYCGISNNGSEDSAVRALHQDFNRQMIACLAAGLSENSVCTTVSRDSAAPLARMQAIRSQVTPLDSVMTNSGSLVTRTNAEIADLRQQIINAQNQIVNLESFIRARQRTVDEATANITTARNSRTTLATEFDQRKAEYDRLLARLNGVNCGSVAYPVASPLPAMPALPASTPAH